MYLDAKPKKRVWFQSEQEIGVHQEIVVFVIGAICGLKGSGSSWALALRKLIRDLLFTTYISNEDLWMKVDVDES